MLRKMIEDIIDELLKKFPNTDWDIDWKDNVEKFEIRMNNWDLYFSEEFQEFNNKIREKHSQDEFYCVFVNKF